jgi:REP element-mobilizing transposase RayT
MERKKSMSQKLRMEGRDYSRPGWYFVTLGADYHKPLFGAVERGQMKPNALGQLVDQCWRGILQHYRHIELGAWQVMPTHFHGLVQIVRPGRAGLGEVLNQFKGSVTREWRRSGGRGSCQGEKEQVWAPNYYDVICFDAEELAVRENYVRANPRRWALRDIPQGRVRQSWFKGNRALLCDSKPCRALRVSRKTSDVEIVQLQKELAAFDGLVCSTFFSPGERLGLKALLSGSAQIVWVLPMAMPKYIPVDWTDAFLEERALWLSAFSDDRQDATRATCEQANRWVEQFCAQK